MMGERPALDAARDHRARHHVERAHVGVADVVQQHRGFGAVLGREVEAERDMAAHVLFVGFDPGNPADDVGPERHRLAHQALCAGLAKQAVLRECHDLNVDDAAKLLADREQRLDALQPGLGVDVGEGADVEVAVERGERHRAPCVRDDPGRVVVALHRCGEIDRLRRLAHAAALIGL
ncbi:hypothetical protein ABIF41_005925 [Bradyrhizobium japonicum]